MGDLYFLVSDCIIFRLTFIIPMLTCTYSPGVFFLYASVTTTVGLLLFPLTITIVFSASCLLNLALIFN